MALRFDHEDMLVFADAHDQVAGHVLAASQPDPELIAAMTSGYGPVGAEFTAAVAEFQSAFALSGTQLANRYQAHAENIRVAAGRYVTTDQSGAQDVGATTV
jgi:Excreted virulence factor EspC, type VII ESX diderm